MIEFNFNNQTKLRIKKERLKKILEKFTQIFYPDNNIQLSTTIVTQSKIKKLNQKYFGKNAVTDVISLESGVEFQPKSLGEIIICGDKAQKEARFRHHPLQKEIEILFCHGLIHLLGKDHDTLEQKKDWQSTLAKLRKAI